MTELKILSIDAWNGPDGWTWNQSFKIGTISRVEFTAFNHNTRKLLRWMRENSYLTVDSVGKCRVDWGDSSDTLVEIQDRRTGEPVYAISAVH